MTPPTLAPVVARLPPLGSRPETLQWPMDGRVDQRRVGIDEIAKFGCAFLCAVELGRWLRGEEPASPALVRTLYFIARDKGWLGDDCEVLAWGRLVNWQSPAVAEYLGWRSPSFLCSGDAPPPGHEATRGVVCVDEWEHREGPHVWGHYTVWAQVGDRRIAYDPDGTIAPGLSRTRRFGRVVSRRAFELTEGVKMGGLISRVSALERHVGLPAVVGPDRPVSSGEPPPLLESVVMEALAPGNVDPKTDDRPPASVFFAKMFRIPSDLIAAFRRTLRRVSVGELRAAHQRGPLAHMQLIPEDVTYVAGGLAEFKALLDYRSAGVSGLGTEMIRYVAPTWECRNYASLFCCVCTGALGTSAVGKTLDWGGNHSYNEVWAFDSAGQLAASIVEPQTDSIVPKLDPARHYTGNGAVIVGG